MAGRDLIIVIIAITVLWLVWYATGGPESERARGGPFIEPLPPLDTGETYSAPARDSGERGSLLNDMVRIVETGSARADNPQREYIVIQAPRTNKESVRIDNWHVRNKEGSRFEIGGAARVLYQGSVNRESALYLEPGDRAFLVSGNSPVGASFQVNICSGYLNQHLDFAPPLSRSCPDASADALRSSTAYEQQCIQFISSLTQCEVYLDDTPDHLSEKCASYIRNKKTYNGCVDTHKHDSNFLKSEWRIYLGANSDIWNNGSDLVRLYNAQNQLVDSHAY